MKNKNLLTRNLNMKVAILFLALHCIGCKNFVEVEAPNSITGQSVFTTDPTAAAVLTGIYTRLSSAAGGSFATGINSLSVRCGLSADELTLYSGSTDRDLINVYRNQLSSQSGTNFWNYFYTNLLGLNSAISGINNSNSLSKNVKEQLLGEAYFMRALCYFYLTNLYGDVPIILTNDYTINSVEPRSQINQVYSIITSDLLQAQTLLTHEYKSADGKTNTIERLRPNKDSATALLARTYLYMQKYPEAEKEATSIIDNKNVYDTVSLNDVFSKNSKEAIWQLQPVNAGWNTEDARLFILPTGGPTGLNPVFASNNLLNSFENNDLRNTNWLGKTTTVFGDTYSYPFKYKSAKSGNAVTEYLMVLRLGEQYLIRAEARAQQGNLSGSKNDLNVIRKRAGLSNTTAFTQTELLISIQHERQIELFSEWGHRWLDLKRTGKVNEVMQVVTSQKGGVWSNNWALYPIPLTDIQRNPKLRNAQNIGYQ